MWRAESKTSIVWFRLDLRLSDNPALLAACAASDNQIPVYIWDPGTEANWSYGSASRWWLHQSLQELSESLRLRGSRLLIARGDSLTVLRNIISQTGAGSVFWNRRYEPAVLRSDREIATALREECIAVHTFNAALLHEPEKLKTREGNPFRVFTPFWNNFCTNTEPCPAGPEPDRIAPPDVSLHCLPLAALELEPKVNWASGFRDCFSPGETGAHLRLKLFKEEILSTYAHSRDYPGLDGVSMLSPHLHFGEISPAAIWHALRDLQSDLPERKNTGVFCRELAWREFAHHILFHFPHTSEQPLHEQFLNMPWLDNPEHLKLWQRGQTGYPIVDAGMRQLWQTGWMHNRVRMIVASFLTKDLLISWKQGAEWFWDTLVDADLANNTMGWQWSAGCGADAAPYFRIFNPVLQGEKFDAEGLYVRKWLPELAALPARWIHKPWKAPAEELRKANVELQGNYPSPIIEHDLARRRALEALASTKAAGKPVGIATRT
jgi:deoxyribodipyrimidine photo-lyase